MLFKQNKSQTKIQKKSSINQSVLSIENIKTQLNHSDDIMERELHSYKNHSYIILYLSPLVDQDILESKIIKPLIKMENNDIQNEVHTMRRLFAPIVMKR